MRRWAGWAWLGQAIRRHWLGAGVVLAATLLFFAPLLPRITTYSPGGDAMFNAWTITRMQQCLVGHNCHDITDGNIFYGHQHTLVWSEAQVSTAVLFLPLRLVTDNPVAINNIATISMTFLLGLSMYLLAMHLSGGRRLIAIMCGLIFAFAPFRMSAIWHLQNLSIFAMPLAVLAILKYQAAASKRAARWWLAALFVVLLYQCYASWYQMAFTMLAVVTLVAGLRLARQVSWRQTGMLALVVGLAFIAVLPLAKVYVDSSKQNNSGYSLTEKTLYSSSLKDYAIPSSDTLTGKIFYKLTGHKPSEQMHNGYNPDSQSYHGATLWLAALIGVVLYIRSARRGGTRTPQFVRSRALAYTFAAMAVVGVIISLGPFLKINETYVYILKSAQVPYTVPLPYLLVELLAPQLSFIRAIGRASVVPLMALCCLLALLPHVVARAQSAASRRYRMLGCVGLVLLLAADILPIHMVPMRPNIAQATYQIPAVYRYIRTQPQVDKLVIIASQDVSPGESNYVREQMLWAGYHGRYMYNGHSAFVPRDYQATMRSYYDLSGDDFASMRSKGLGYVLVDKKASTAATNQRASQLPALYDDASHRLIAIPQ